MRPDIILEHEFFLVKSERALEVVDEILSGEGPDGTLLVDADGLLGGHSLTCAPKDVGEMTLLLRERGLFVVEITSK